MPRTLTTSIDIAADASRVWSTLTDFADYPSWNPYYTAAHGPLRAGERVTLQVAMDDSGRTTTSRPVVREVSDGRSVVWRNHFLIPGLLTTTHRFVVLARGPDRSRFEQTEEFRGLLAPVSTAVVDTIEVKLQALSQALKDYCEAR